MSELRRSVCWVLVTVLLTVLALMVTAPTRAQVRELQPALVTTPSTSTPIIYEEAP